MSQYDDLDGAILARIDAGYCWFGAIWLNRVWEESQRLGNELKRDSVRIVDGRLQALRKRGVIEYAKGFGWLKVTKGRP